MCAVKLTFSFSFSIMLGNIKAALQYSLKLNTKMYTCFLTMHVYHFNVHLSTDLLGKDDKMIQGDFKTKLLVNGEEHD